MFRLELGFAVQIPQTSERGEFGNNEFVRVLTTAGHIEPTERRGLAWHEEHHCIALSYSVTSEIFLFVVGPHL